MVRLAGEQPLTFLRVLLVGYVHHHADEAIRFAILAVQALATRLDPADISVFLQQPIFLNIFIARDYGVVDGVGDTLCVLGMDTREVVRQRCALRPLGRIH